MGNGGVDGLESRFERYSEVMVKALGHASRGQAARGYLRGLMLPAKAYRTVTWREGTNTRLGSRFARVRCSAAHHNCPRKEQWLIIEWPAGQAQPTQYFLSNLLEGTAFKTLVHTLKMRWRIEHDYRSLEEEVGLDRYEGRNRPDFHHHARLFIAAYGFLMLHWPSGVKKTPFNYKHLTYPRPSARVALAPATADLFQGVESFEPRGSGRVPNYLRALAVKPAIVKPFATLITTFTYGGTLPPALASRLERSPLSEFFVPPTRVPAICRSRPRVWKAARNASAARWSARSAPSTRTRNASWSASSRHASRARWWNRCSARSSAPRRARTSSPTSPTSTSRSRT